jgi:hypothetical protein
MHAARHNSEAYSLRYKSIRLMEYKSWDDEQARHLASAKEELWPIKSIQAIRKLFSPPQCLRQYRSSEVESKSGNQGSTDCATIEKATAGYCASHLAIYETHLATNKPGGWDVRLKIAKQLYEGLR